MVFSSIGGTDHLYGMVRYCLNGSLCRRKLIAEHFDEDWGDADCNKMCDVCASSANTTKEIELKEHCKTLNSIIENAAKQDTKLTAQKLLDAWFLKGPVNLRHKGKEPNFSRTLGEDVIAFLMVNAYLEEDFHFTAYTTISYIKQGPAMDLVNDPDFSIKMPVRKYIPFELESPAPKNTQIVENNYSNEKKSENQKTSASNISPKSLDKEAGGTTIKRKLVTTNESHKKKIKTFVIESDDED